MTLPPPTDLHDGKPSRGTPGSRPAVPATVLAATLLLLLGAPRASAFPSRVGLLPNGPVNSCANCHVNPAGGGARNPFGQAVEATIAEVGEPFWGLTDLHLLDSDADGRANGVELNDPEGDWRAGEADPGGFVTNPGVPDAPTPTPTGTPLGTASPTPTPSPTQSPLPTPVPTPNYDFVLETVVSGLFKPTFAAIPPDGTGRLFIGEHPGRIRIAVNGTLLPNPFLDISADGLNRVSFGDPSEGLNGLAFHPRFAENGRYFIAYTRLEDNATVVREYRVSSGSPNVSDPIEIPILESPAEGGVHPGGGLLFGPDGLLYIAFGDGARGSPAQDLNILWGKLLRIDVDRTEDGKNYAVPPDNPFAGQENRRPEIFAYGFRHPWRFSIDAATGDLWLGDVGLFRVEELDLVLSGRNYGWPILEGDLCYVPPDCDPTGLEPPVETYLHETLFDLNGTPLRGGCSVTGGLVYRGSDFPALQGKYVFGDYCSMLWTLERGDDGNWFRVERYPAEWPDSFVHFTEDERGEILVVNHERGLVQRIGLAGGTPSPTPTASPTASPSPTATPVATATPEPTGSPTPTPAPFSNLSTRGFVGEGSEVMIPGFIVEGPGTKRVLISGIGPGLTDFGVQGALADPELALLAGPHVLQANDNWGDSPDREQLLLTGFAPSNEFESAILAELPPGEYTVILGGVGSTGVGLVQLFDIGGDARLRNLSTRLPVGLDERVMIAGITVAGEPGGPPRRVVVRGLGPTLGRPPFGVPGALADPELAVFSGQTLLETNANWREAPDAEQIAASGLAPPDDLEPAILIELPPGAYTAILSGANSTEGTGLVEVYALD